MGAFIIHSGSAAKALRKFLALAITALFVCGSFASAQSEPTPEQIIIQEEKQAQAKLVEALLSLSSALDERQKNLKELNADLEKAKEEA